MRIRRSDWSIDIRLLAGREIPARQRLARHKPRRRHQNWFGWMWGQLLRPYEAPALVPVPIVSGGRWRGWT